MTAVKKTSVDARIVDGAMIASFMGAEPPKVWRADMKSLATSTFEMKEDAGAFHVVMRAGDQAETIAAFPSRDGATDALQALMTAMLTPVGTTAAAAGADTAPKKSFFKRFLRFVFKLALWLFGIAFILWLTVMLFGPKIVGMAMKDPGVTKVQQGTPVPADELFGQ
jgi:hypothetical protein